MKKFVTFLLITLFFIFVFSNIFSVDIYAQKPYELEMSFSYAYSSNNRLAVSGYSVIEVINIGKLEVRKVRRNIFDTTFKFRYNFPTTNIEVSVPFKMRWDSIIKYADTTEEGEPTEEAYLAEGIGDIVINVQTTVTQKESNQSNTRFNFGVKTTTGKNSYSDPDAEILFGSGHYGVKVGASHFMQVDPVILFGSLNYFWNIERDGYDPGDTTQYSIGMAYALTQNFSINARLEQSYTGHVYDQGGKVTGSSLNAASLNLGGSYITDNDVPIDFAVSTGLTEDAADFSIQVSRVYYF